MKTAVVHLYFLLLLQYFKTKFKKKLDILIVKFVDCVHFSFLWWWQLPLPRTPTPENNDVGADPYLGMHVPLE